MENWVEEIEGWDDRPFSDGYAGLHDLADAGFSGAVSTGGTWLFMVSGRVVAVVEYRQTGAGDEVTPADIERFEAASGTAYEAPHPSVPLLVAMQARGGETRGRYYTEDTPVEEVVDTLEEGGFTGYLELSENVLSGDYYTVFQGGRATDLAFIGNARRLLTDEDANERLTDEVGIYEVVRVGIDVVEIPGEPSAAGAGAAGAAGAAGVGAAGAADDPPADDSPEDGPVGPATVTGSPDADGDAPPSEAESGPSTDGSEPDAAERDAAADEDEATPSEASTDIEASTDVETDEPSANEPTASESGEDGSDAPDDSAAVDSSPAGATSETTEQPHEPGAAADSADATPTGASASEDSAGAGGGASAADLETRSVPSLDPEQSWTDDGGDGSGGGPASSPSTPDSASVEPGDKSEELAETRADLREARERLADAREELAATREERDELAAEVDRLRARVRELEADEPGGGPSLSVAEALAGTNLFVRYDSKGKTTVEDVHDGEGDVEALRSNLQLSDHTQFESADATVEGEPFEAWLADALQYRFAEWLVTTLVVEIRDTGAVNGLRELYDSLPEIDRIEFDGSVTVSDEEGDRDAAFDVVCRDRMGDPLVVARLERSRDPVTESSMGSLVADATDVATTEESLAGAFYVTSAFFSPESLETAREATSGSLLSRDKRRSHVKISRNRGYHLGLVESREATFHLSVPDL